MQRVSGERSTVRTGRAAVSAGSNAGIAVA